MKILALDQKVSGTGWCLANDSEYITSGYHKSIGLDSWDKIDEIGIWLQSLIVMGKVNVLVLEFPSGNKQNMDTNVKLGAVLYECIRTGKVLHCEIVIVRPSEVKKTGIYKGKLREVGKYKKFDIPLKEDGSVNKAQLDRINDEIDAIGVWLAGLKRRGESSE